MPSNKIKDSFGFEGYIADVFFPGKIKGKFHTKVRVVANFLELDIIDTVFCWKWFPLSCDFEQVAFCSINQVLDHSTMVFRSCWSCSSSEAQLMVQ